MELCMRRNIKFKKRRRIMIILIVILIAIISIYLYFKNNLLQVTNIEITSSKISSKIKIVQLSDLHGKQFGNNNSVLINTVNKKKPDIIVFTGDLIDVTTNDITPSINTLIELGRTTPVYYIAGNHEHGAYDVEKIAKILKAAKVNVLNNETKEIIIKNNDISILGLDELNVKDTVINNLIVAFEKRNDYKIFLSHYPENFHNDYNNYNIDLVMSGHAHGGQVIIPFIGGVYAPGQGFFPKYYIGKYTENNVNLIVSRGLGNSRFPFRINNRPEIVVLILIPEK
jgi:predicted MPP superfamily phosphohydrolase